MPQGEIPPAGSAWAICPMNSDGAPATTTKTSFAVAHNLVRQLAIAEGTSRTSGTVLAFGAPRGCRGQSAQFDDLETSRRNAAVRVAAPFRR
jgi:hypothetical protein